MLFRRRQPQNQPRARIAAPQSRGEVFSYHANRSVREGSNNIGRIVPEEVSKRRRSMKWAKRVPMFAALIVIIICCSVVLGLNSSAKVVPVTTGASGPNKLFLQDTTVYQQAAQRLFATNVLNKNKLTVDTARITRELQNEFPELQNVSIALPLIGHRPIVYLQPASPILFLTTQGGGLYVLDRSGRAVVGGAEASAQTGKLPIPTVHDASGVAVKTGQVALPSDDIAFIVQVVAQLQAKGLQITSLDLPAGASELDVRLQGVAYVVRFNMQGNSREQVGAFLAAKQFNESQHVAPGQYMDVRVPERVYYR
ncbi:MAG TPA: hypothetical protein VJR27_03780 [Candidatus Saccharimonadales bacterium]|nr:hypothetical protein [Candidatus Saccharimonadales bacterium]